MQDQLRGRPLNEVLVNEALVNEALVTGATWAGVGAWCIKWSEYLTVNQFLP